jgi:hypothetical protein
MPLAAVVAAVGAAANAVRDAPSASTTVAT